MDQDKHLTPIDGILINFYIQKCKKCKNVN